MSSGTQNPIQLVPHVLKLYPIVKVDASRYEGWTLTLQHGGCKLLCDGQLAEKPQESWSREAVARNPQK